MFSLFDALSNDWKHIKRRYRDKGKVKKRVKKVDVKGDKRARDKRSVRKDC